MLDILKKLDSIESKTKKKLKESTLTECPPDMGMSPSSGPASLNISAGSASEMAQILKALMTIDQGGAEPSVIVGQPEPESALGGAVGAGIGALAGGPIGAGLGAVAGDKLSGENEWSNEPDEEYQDHEYMTKALSGGINRKKDMFKPAAKGDNPMAVPEKEKQIESIKARLYSALAEKANKPDFLDVDKDGNKKEPFKKAVSDKKVKEAAKPDFLDADKDGNKKEPMKKAIADKKKNPFKK